MVYFLYIDVLIISSSVFKAHSWGNSYKRCANFFYRKEGYKKEYFTDSETQGLASV